MKQKPTGRAATWSTTAIVVCSMSPSVTRSVYRKRVSSLRLAASATPTTTHWQIGDVPPAKSEMAYYRQREESAMAA